MHARVVMLPTYNVTIARGVLDHLGAEVTSATSGHRYALVTDSHVGPLYAERCRGALGTSVTELFTIPAGEKWKTRESWASVTDQMLASGLGRDTVVVALGGGVVGDLAGFVAATYLRGVPFVQVPTSLLAMIDASIGGKTGVDTPAGKNLVGAFHQPAAVLADPDVLETLPPEQLRAGLAEAIKHGVIADARHLESVMHFAAMDDAVDTRHEALVDLVSASVEIKANVVRRDEREAGLRKILNFGHTLGHAIELESNYRMLHGEAVAVGMVLEGELSERLSIAEPGTAEAIRDAVRRVGLPDRPPAELSTESIVRATHSDKKARAGHAEYALPSRIGSMAGSDRGWSFPVPDDIVSQVLTQESARRR